MRYFLAVLLITVAAVSACTKPGVTGVSVNPALRPFIPPGTKALAAVDVDRLKASSFYKRHQNELNFPLLDSMSERVGLDPRRDLADVLLAWNGRAPVVLARGRLNPDAISSKLRSFGTQSAPYKNYTLFGDDRTAFAFLKHGVVVGGSLEIVRSEIDLQNNGASGLSDELQARLARIPKASQVWAVSRGGLAFADIPMRSDLESALSNIVSYVSDTNLGLALDTGTHLNAEIVCISNEGAQRVRDALRGGIGLARLTTRDNESDLLQLYDAIQVTQDQQTIRVTADISGELTDKLLAGLPRITNRAGELLKER